MILKLLAFVSSVSYASIVGSDYNYTPLTINSNSNNCEKRINASVARVEINSSSEGYRRLGVCGTQISSSVRGQYASSGTGFLVSLNPPILLTNRHNLRIPIDAGIIEDTAEHNINPCLSNKINFNFTGLNETVGCKEIHFAYDSSFGVDAVFVELDRLPPNANYLNLSSSTASDELIQFADHPSGSDQINLNQCRVSSVYEHNCDSLPGSSGAPLINSNCEVAGLHFAGGGNKEGCTQFAFPDHQRWCNIYPKIPDTCRNYFNTSPGIKTVLSHILSRRMSVRDATQPFDAKERYTLLPPQTAPATSTATESID